MTVRELLTRKLIDYGETMKSASIACGLSNNAIKRIVDGKHLEPQRKTRRALCRYFDIEPRVLDAAIDEGRQRNSW